MACFRVQADSYTWVHGSSMARKEDFKHLLTWARRGPFIFVGLFMSFPLAQKITDRL